MSVPWRCGDGDDFGEDFGAFQGGEAADHAGDGVADEDARLDLELVQDGEEVVGVAVEGGVAREVEVLGVGGAGAHVVEENYAVILDEVRDDVLPHGLVRAEPVAQHHELLAHPHHAHIVRLQKRGQLSHCRESRPRAHTTASHRTAPQS
jgi:hypothetical protein